MNPLSDFLKSKGGGKILTEQEAIGLKKTAFAHDVGKVKAIDEAGNQITLGEKGAEFENVDFVAGLWRIQTKFPHKITCVRDKNVVLMNKLPRQESTNFEYWQAKVIGYNCHGPFIIASNASDIVVACYDTDNGPLWGYGATIEAARAFLGLKLYDMYKDLIHGIACKNKLQQE